MKHVAVYGLGYIGLPTAAVLARSGLSVTGVDIDEELVRVVNAGRPRHTDEAGLADLIQEAVASGRLRAATQPVTADVHIVAVGTPVTSDRRPDLTAVDAVVRSIATVLKAGDLIIVESTIPPYTCEGRMAPMIAAMTSMRHGLDYHLAHCPERVIPGDIVRELVHNDRIVGGTSPAATQEAASVYRRFVKGAVIETDARTAETCKLMENAYRDVNIALANELAELAAHVGVDPDTAFALANRHPRVNLHRPGIGVGGHCIPVDPWFLVAVKPQSARLLRTSREINDALPHRVADAIRDEVARIGADHVTLLGLSYKPDVDDMRESPSVEVAMRLAQDESLSVSVVEPHAACLPQALTGRVNVRLKQLDDVHSVRGPVVRLTAHRAFDALLEARPDVMDGRDLLLRATSRVPASHRHADVVSDFSRDGVVATPTRDEEVPAGRV